MGPGKMIEVSAQTTMASSVAARLVAAKELGADSERCIAMRAQQRMQLAPEKGGGRVSEARGALGKIWADGMAPSEFAYTAIEEFAKLLEAL
eukprot:6189300-Pleurochrysis_carterae.AAC.1